jgi:methionine biosynthesis protein MetW
MQSENFHKTDNRLYDYSSWVNENRDEYDYIISFIKPGSIIIDLGCGNGSLIQRLIKEKNCTVSGIELSDSGVQVCKSKNLNVTKGSIDQDLPFEDNSFDYAVCNVTLQMVMFPEKLMSEMKRIARFQVVSFPNFGFYKNRLDLLLKGIMPPKALFGYSWYNTGHIHLFSIKDFYTLINHVGGLKTEVHTFTKTKSPVSNYLMELIPNLFQLIPIFLLSKYDQ